MKYLGIIAFFTLSYWSFSQGNSLLWEIKGNGLTKPSYLFGTYHSLDSRAHEFGDSVIIKLLKSDVVVTETAEESNSKDLIQYAFMKNKTLKDVMKEEDYLFVKEKIFEKMGQNIISLNNMKPIFIMIVAGELNSRKEMEFTVDDYIKNLAAKNKKKNIGLETKEEALKAIDAIPLEEQSKMLIDFFKDYDKNILLTDSVIQLYQKQDLKNLNVIYKSNKVPEGFDANLVKKRNEIFTEKLILMIKKQSVFCAVGVLHLPGETGLINALRKKGFTVSPVVNKYTPKKLIIADKREWFNYGNDTLMISINFPHDPFVEITNPQDNNKPDGTVIYFLNDSLYGLSYSISIFNIPDTNSINNPDILYSELVKNLNSNKGWIKIIEDKLLCDGRIVKQLEYNISKGISNRIRIIANGHFLYILSVTGNKKNIHSDLADHFFEQNSLLNPLLYLDFKIKDELNGNALEHFDIRITSTSLDTVLKNDSIGFMSFSLPTIEDEYLISVSSAKYVTKKIMVNTNGISQISKPELRLIGNVGMIKKQNGINYDIYNTPVARAKIINKKSIFWDMDYIDEMKSKINNKKQDD